jgi:HSP20 family protein
MARERDLFENFERMRREMDELFGDVFERRLGGPRRHRGFSPSVDVYYAGDPPRAVVQADLAGIDAGAIELELNGRELVLSGHRRAPQADGRSYQQVEIAHGPFRRVVPLGADVDPDAAKATYEDGILTVELPLRPAGRTRTVKIRAPGEAGPRDEPGETG